MSSMFSASLDFMLTSIFLVSACISILTSKLMRSFQLEPPCCQPGFQSTVSYSLKGNEPMKSLCIYHNNKLTAINNNAVDRQRVHVHNLCEDCVLLNFYSSDKSSRFSDNVFVENIANESSEKSTDEQTCILCTYQNVNSFSKGIYTFPKYVKVEGAARSFQGDMGSDSGSADCSSLDSMRSCCFYCKEPRGRNRRNFPIERKFARFSVESLEDRSWDSLSTEPEIPFESMKEKKISVKEGSPKRYRNIDKLTKGSTFNGKLDVTGEAGGLFEQHIYWTRLQQGENIERNTFYGSKFSDEGEAHPLEFHTNSFTTSDLVVKYDTTLKGSTSKKDRENETRLPHVDAKSKVLTRASEHENRMQLLQKAIKVEREAVDTFYKELEGHMKYASVLAASETLARIDDLQEEKTAVQIEASEKIELCRHILLDDRVRQWRRQKLKREEFENCYKTGRMSSAKWSEKPVLVPEAREKTHSIGGSELKIGVKDYGRDSIGIVDTISDNLTEEASKIKSFKKIEAPNTEKTMKVKICRRQMNSLPQTKTTNPEANTLRVPPKVEREKLRRKLLLVPERSNDAALESGTAKEEERTTESGDMEDGQYYESSDSIYPVKQQHIGKKLLRPLFDFPDNSQWASRVRDKKESCSEIDYSEDDASVLGFYFETEGDECWSDFEDLLNDKTDGPTDSGTENTDECITIEMDSTVTMHQDDEKIKKVVGVGLNFIC